MIKRMSKYIPHKTAKYGYKVYCKACKHKWFPKNKKPYDCPRCGTKL